MASKQNFSGPPSRSWRMILPVPWGGGSMRVLSSFLMRTLRVKMLNILRDKIAQLQLAQDNHPVLYIRVNLHFGVSIFKSSHFYNSLSLDLRCLSAKVIQVSHSTSVIPWPPERI